MTRKLPLIPTVIVAFAVAAMLALGVWQFTKSGAKTALIDSYRAAARKPSISFPYVGPVPEKALFRRSSATCLRVVGWQVEIGRSAGGQSGYRHIAKCSTGAEGPGLLADMGVSSDPAAKVAWTGGSIDGMIVSEPDHNSLVARIFGRAAPLRPMLIADRAAPGLEASAKPSPEDVPNNHFSYGVQWFLFAGIALTIYVLALGKRWAETT